MPLYNTATVAAALGSSPKWLDNLLSHNKIDGVGSGRQGVPRRLSADAVRIVTLAKELIEHAALSAPAAIGIATTMIGQTSSHGSLNNPQRVRLSPSVWIELDVTALDQEVSAGLARAVEVTPHPLRGRPRRARGSRST